jgi:carbamoyl-phosphate synthase large subunit
VIGVNDLQKFIQEVGLPIILKPADSQSSRGVIKIDVSNQADINQFVISSLKYANCGYLIAEEFVEGQEVTVEGFTSDFKHRTLAISLKKHFRTGIASELCYPANIPDSMYKEIEILNDKFVENSGLKFGITHAEYMINTKTGRIALIEIACRGGGSLISSDIVNWVSGVNVYDLYYANMKGAITDVKGLKILKKNAILKFFEFNPGIVKSIEGFNELKNMKGLISSHLAFKPGDTLQPADDDRSRQGYFIAFAESFEELNTIINKVNETVLVSYM